MTTPVSIGDAIMLSQLAYTLARAFTSGRRSAPAEFHEVQNQLYALGSALGFLANDRSGSNRAKAGEGPDPGKIAHEQYAILEQMISNCRETLKHLELLVSKYMEIEPHATDRGRLNQRTWRQDVWRNWKKIQWTTKGGDLDKLRSNLAMHTRCLNLALSAMHRCVLVLHLMI
jgi:hypothetical protein